MQSTGHLTCPRGFLEPWGPSPRRRVAPTKLDLKPDIYFSCLRGQGTLGEGGALCGALLPITVFLAVKVTGGSGLALWDRTARDRWQRLQVGP